ncbi:zinc finger, CCCH-type containing protein, partial [Tanacetum coccineum]
MNCLAFITLGTCYFGKFCRHNHPDPEEVAADRHRGMWQSPATPCKGKSQILVNSEMEFALEYAEDTYNRYFRNIRSGNAGRNIRRNQQGNNQRGINR